MSKNIQEIAPNDGDRDNSVLQGMLRDPIGQGSSDNIFPSPSLRNRFETLQTKRGNKRRRETLVLDQDTHQQLRDKVTMIMQNELRQKFQAKKMYQGRKVSEYYNSKRVRGCFFARAVCSILVPLLIAWWIVPIYEKMHVETDRLNYLKDDWKYQFPLSELKVITAPKIQKSLFDEFDDETNVIIDIAEDLSNSISGGLVKQTNICSETFGEKFEPLVPARWEGMAMGCNCTGTEQEQQYYEGSCTYYLTLQGCLQMLPVYPIDIAILARKMICGKRENQRYYSMPRPNSAGICPNQTKICGGTSRHHQYCIDVKEKCPINDVRLVKHKTDQPETETDTSEFFALDGQYDIEVRRDADEDPIVNLKLSEAPPCLDPDKISHEPDRHLIVLEFGKLAEGCPLKIDQDQRYRLLSQEHISEHQLYTENKVIDVLRKYQPEDVYYPPGVDVNLYLYGSTNFIWNPTCCQSAGLKAISADDIYSMVLAYKTIQFLLVIAIALIFSHVFISGMLLNFLLLMPFCKAWLVKGGKSQSSKNELYTKILSGQIPCLEYSRALVNSLCGFFYFTLVVSILFVAKLHEKDIKVVESMQAAMPCPECGKQQWLIALELSKVHKQIEELRR